MKLKQAIEKYEKYITVTRSKGTLRYLKGKTAIISRYLGTYECSMINNDILLDFIIKQRKRNPQITHRTINKYIQTINQVIKYETGEKVNFDKLPENKKTIKTISIEIQEKIFEYYDNNQNNLILLRNYIMFRLLLETGLRISELLSIKVGDIEFNTGTIHIRITKTNEERYVFFSKKTSLLLNKYIISSKLNNELFIDFITGDQLTVIGIESICQRLAKKLDINQSISPHKWRHTFATTFIRKSGNLEVLRQIMGHTNLATTQKYLHINKDFLHEEYFRVHKNMSE